MKQFSSVFLTVFLIALISQGSCYLYSNEDPYSDFLSKNTDFAERHVSGFNLKITDEAMSSLTNKLRNALRGEMDEDVDKLLIENDDESDTEDEFENVDLTDFDTVPESAQPIQLSDLKLKTVFGKREFSYTKIFAIVGKSQKYFSKLYQSSREGGAMSSKVHGDLNTTLTSSTTGEVDSHANTTIWSKGKEYKTTATVASKFGSNSAEKKIGTEGDQFGSAYNLDVSSKVNIRNASFDMKTSIKTSAETFLAPFGVYLTLFESKLNVSGKIMEGAVIKGEITSRVVYFKKGHSLTKSKMRGYVITEVETPAKACGISKFETKTHTWTKVRKSEDSEDSSEENELMRGNKNAGFIVDVWTSSKTRVFGKASAVDTKIFSGSGVVTLQKASVTFPPSSGVAEDNGHAHGVNFMAKQGLGDYLSSLRGITSRVVGF